MEEKIARKENNLKMYKKIKFKKKFELKKKSKRNINTPIKIIKKERNPGIELLRILAMYAIIVHHIIFFGILINKYRKYPQIYFINLLCFWHISVFGMISGIVVHNTHKYSNLFYLWFCTLFYSVGIHMVYKKYYPYISNKNKTYEYFFPVIFEKYWYFTAYFGMYLFLPLINKGLSIVNKKELKIIILSILLVFIILKDYILPDKDPFRFSSGYSPIGLLLLYVIGAYLGKYVISLNRSSFWFVFYILIYFCSSYLTYYLKYYKGKRAYLKIIIKLKQLFLVRINSIAMILQGVSLILFFSQIKYNKFIAKILSFVGPLTFGVYLSGTHKYIYTNELPKLFRNYPSNLPLDKLIYLILLKGIQISFICLFIDYIRLLLFSILQIRRICIFIEKIINIIIC